jgi:exodeoxyribonuclease VII large subunit
MSSPSSLESAKVLTVGEFSRSVKNLLEEAFPAVWISGEASNVARPASGHVYFTLKDAESQLRCVMYRAVAQRMKFELRDGQEMIARGRVNVYLPRGEYQLTVDQVQPKGIGPLELAFRQLQEKLAALGFFEPKRKKPLPRFPRRLVLITSPTGAAVRDMLEILGRRWPMMDVLISPVRVQGEGAAQEIAAALQMVNRLRGIDAIIVGRGGGSLEDLWAFNEEIVARAIYASRIPVISGVGHETDLTIADLVADVRALTPSEAAERVVPNRVELLEGLRGVRVRLNQLLVRKAELARTRLSELARQRCLRLPLERVREEERKLDDLDQRLKRAARVRLERCQQQLEKAGGRLEGLSPLNVLARGYSLTRRESDLAMVVAPEQVQPGQRLLTQVRGGSILSRVE